MCKKKCKEWKKKIFRTVSGGEKENRVVFGQRDALQDGRHCDGGIGNESDVFRLCSDKLGQLFGNSSETKGEHGVEELNWFQFLLFGKRTIKRVFRKN